MVERYKNKEAHRHFSAAEKVVATAAETISLYLAARMVTAQLERSKFTVSHRHIENSTSIHLVLLRTTFSTDVLLVCRLEAPTI